MNDTFIISRLEALFARSPVSPYAMARFFLVGKVFAADTLVWHGVMQWNPGSVIFAIAIPGLSILELKEITKAESENAKGFTNRLKFSGVFYRLVILAMTLIEAVNFSILRNITESDWLAIYVLWTLVLYLSALNWTPPPTTVARLWRSAVGNAA